MSDHVVSSPDEPEESVGDCVPVDDVVTAGGLVWSDGRLATSTGY